MLSQQLRISGHRKEYLETPKEDRVSLKDKRSARFASSPRESEIPTADNWKVCVVESSAMSTRTAMLDRNIFVRRDAVARVFSGQRIVECECHVLNSSHPLVLFEELA